MQRTDLLMFLCSSNFSLSSILAAVIAFLFSVKTGLKGTGRNELESFYRKIILALAIIFAVSVASLVYFTISLLVVAKSIIISRWDYVFIIAILTILPALVVLWFIVYAKDK